MPIRDSLRALLSRCGDGFDGRRGRAEAQRRNEEESALLRVYQQGFNARMDGLPRVAPDGFGAELGLDYRGTWIAGWEAADRVVGER